MYVKVRFSHWLPKLIGVTGVTIGSTIYYSCPRTAVTPNLFIHEFIHIYQYQKHGVIGFLFKYLMSYLGNLATYKSHAEAYENISFEREAYTGQNRPFTHEEATAYVYWVINGGK